LGAGIYCIYNKYKFVFANKCNRKERDRATDRDGEEERVRRKVGDKEILMSLPCCELHKVK